MTNDQMMRDALTNQNRKPVSKRTLIVSAAIAAIVITGGGFGVKALTDYRADITASEQAAADYYEAADQRVLDAEAAALAAQESAEAAQAATDSLTAAEEAAAAQAAAEEAARVAAEAAAANQPKTSTGGGTSGGGGPVKCPAGTVANSVDDYGNESNCQPPCNAYDDNNVCIGAPVQGYKDETSA